MPFNWHDFLDLARWLETNTPAGVSAEAAGRVAVSRAYYSAFCHARNYARDYLGFVPHNDNTDHGRLKAHLRQKRRWNVADRLELMRVRRNACDYHDDLTIPVTTMLAVVIQNADYVFRSLPPPAKP